MMMTVDNV